MLLFRLTQLLLPKEQYNFAIKQGILFPLAITGAQKTFNSPCNLFDKKLK